MPAKASRRKVEVEVEVSDTPAQTEASSPHVQEDEVEKKAVADSEETPPSKPILVAEAEPEEDEPPTPPTDSTADNLSINPSAPDTSSHIFGPLPTDPPKSNKKLFWILIVVFALLGAIAGGIGIYLQNPSDGLFATPTPTPEATLVPTPSPQVELDRADMSIQIQNGSGVSGAAATAQEFLEGLGYAVADIGNADSSDYETTQVSIAKSAQKYSDLILEDLATKYTLADKVETLAADSNYDVVVILGAK